MRLSGRSASVSAVAGRPWQKEQSNREKSRAKGRETEGQGPKARGRCHSRRPRPVTVTTIGTSSATVTVIVTRDGVRRFGVLTSAHPTWISPPTDRPDLTP